MLVFPGIFRGLFRSFRQRGVPRFTFGGFHRTSQKCPEQFEALPTAKFEAVFGMQSPKAVL